MPTRKKPAAKRKTAKRKTAKRKTAKRKTTKRKTTKRKTTKRKTSRKTPGSRAETVAWAARLMKKKRDISMTELKKLGKKDGHKVYPLILGLARKELGWGRPKKKATRRTTAPARPSGRRGPGRPRKAVDPTAAIHAVIARMRDLEREADALRKAIGRIADITRGM